MNPQQWEDVKEIVGECLDLDPPARRARLAAADPVLRAEVESLLAAYDEAEDFLDTSAWESIASCELMVEDGAGPDS